MCKRADRVLHFLMMSLKHYHTYNPFFFAVSVRASDMIFVHTHTTFMSTSSTLLKVCHLQIRQLKAVCESSHLVLYIKRFHLDRCGIGLHALLHRKTGNHPHAHLSAFIQLNYSLGVLLFIYFFL